MQANSQVRAQSEELVKIRAMEMDMERDIAATETTDVSTYPASCITLFQGTASVNERCALA